MGGVSAIYEAALMKLMEGKYDLKKFEKIIGGAHRIKYYGEEDMQWKTNVREAVGGGGNGVWGGRRLQQSHCCQDGRSRAR